MKTDLLNNSEIYGILTKITNDESFRESLKAYCNMALEGQEGLAKMKQHSFG